METSASGCCPYDGGVLTEVLPMLLTFEFLLGVLGNGAALWIFCCHIKPWKSSTVFLFNLALADFLLLVVLPFRASYYAAEMDWRFGELFCRVFLFMVSLNRSGSIVFLTVVAVDRYMRVVHPHHQLNSMLFSRAVCLAVALWGIAASLNVHLLAQPQSLLLAGSNTTQCESFIICLQSDPASLWYKSVFVVLFLVPLAVIVLCSLRIVSELRKRHLDQHARIKKALHVVSAVVVVFVICFLPSNLAQLLIWVKIWTRGRCDAMQDVNKVFYASLALTYLNSVLDPVVYYFSSPTFKKVFSRLPGDFITPLPSSTKSTNVNNMNKR
uniref:G-protein coupled receptors family 1 profile domain-containing protein n=1 Tax=Denticeps clupeoides TaxID=299321 RepID=A0AAY4CCL7_9TELE